MKNILCYGDSNTWGNVAGSMDPKLRLAQRFNYDERWVGILQQLLGNSFYIIEAGLNGRSTAFDEKTIVRPSRNGLATLPGILEMHYPLDLVIFMLGTNDLKIEFNATLEDITQNMSMLIEYVKKCSLGKNFQAPQIMLICPPPIIRIDIPAFNLFFDDSSISKSNQLTQYYEKLAEKENCSFINAGNFVKISKNDGVHIDKESQVKLAKAIQQKIEEMKI